MAGKTGQKWRNPGPRLPDSISPAQGDEMDPAKGETVPRCFTCGVPLELVTGSFIPDTGQRFAGRRFRYRLCVRCIEHANGPLDPDPRHVEEAA